MSRKAYTIIDYLKEDVELSSLKVQLAYLAGVSHMSKRKREEFSQLLERLCELSYRVQRYENLPKNKGSIEAAEETLLRWEGNGNGEQ